MSDDGLIYMESADQDQMIMEALRIENLKQNHSTCEICFEEYFGSEIIIFSQCAHIFCKNCFKLYVEENKQTASLEQLKCPQYQCKTNVKEI